MISRSQKTFLVLGIGFLLLTVGGYTIAETSSTQVSACTKNNGSIYLIGPNFSRQTCLSGDTQIDWPTIAGTPKQLRLQDSTGQDLGNITNIMPFDNGSQQFDLFDERRLFVTYKESIGLILNIYEDGNTSDIRYRFPKYTDIRYTTTDCTGVPYITGVSPHSRSIVSVPSQQGGDRFFIRSTTTDILVNMQSTLSYGDGSCQQLPDQAYARELVEITLPVIVPPLSIVESQF